MDTTTEPIHLDEEASALGFDEDRLERIGRHLDGYVESGRLPGWSVLVARHGQTLYRGCGGWRDVEAHLAVQDDTIFRIYSMTKPITSMVALMLVEEGRIDLLDPVSEYLPGFGSPMVYRGGPPTAPVLVPATEPMRLWHLLTHTAGLTYGFHFVHPVDAMYRHAGFTFGTPPHLDLAACCERWASLPLMFEPGSSWCYSVASDVLGRVVEVVEGRPLDVVLRERVLGPLSMTDTGFCVDERRAGDVAALYTPEPGAGRVRRVDPAPAVPTASPRYLSGGGGLFSTIDDYHRFLQLVVGRGETGGIRLLSPRTVDLMAANHLPDNADLEQFGQRLYAETPFDGIGFGLGFSVLLDPVKAKTLGSRGELAWGGAASTAFWVDPATGVSAIFMTQLVPSNSLPVRSELRTLVYQAMVE